MTKCDDFPDCEYPNCKCPAYDKTVLGVPDAPKPAPTLVKFNEGKPLLSDIAGRLRLLADEYETGKFENVQSCLVIFSQPSDEWPIMFGYGSVDGLNSPIVVLQLALQKWISKVMRRAI